MVDMAAILGLDQIEASYGIRPVIGRVSMKVEAREIVALIGHNGAGKSTLLKVAIGLLEARSGKVSVDGQIVLPSPRRMLRLGISYLPQGLGVFAELTVAENLRLGILALGLDQRSSSEYLKTAFELFPDLAPMARRRAAALSGGEKQMLAIASILVTQPRVLLLDEPTAGLAPHLASALLRWLRSFRERGGAAVVVEQRVQEVLAVSDRCYILRNGVVTFEGVSATLDADALRNYFL